MFGFKRYLAAIFLLSGLASSYSNASPVITQSDLIPDLYLPGFAVVVACPLGGPCFKPDQAWTKESLPLFQLGETISISTASPSFSFYLGNSLEGVISVSMMPYFQFNSQPPQDELIASIASRTSIISTTNYGTTFFDANGGNDYYLLLNGTVRSIQTYQLQISEVPLPPAWAFMSFGLAALVPLARRKP